MKFTFSLSAILALASTTIATDWHFLTWEPASGEQFIGFSGDMVVPDLPEAATYYIWPGLQPTDNSGVYQNVLDGRSGTWWFGSGWCCSNPSLPWGGGFNTNKGDVISFKNIQTSGTNWTSTVIQKGDSSLRANNKFALSYKNFNQAILAIELDGPTWTFGSVVYKNLLITSTGTDTSWCNGNPYNYNGATNFTTSGISAKVVGNTVQCTIKRVDMVGPIGSP